MSKRKVFTASQALQEIFADEDSEGKDIDTESEEDISFAEEYSSSDIDQEESGDSDLSSDLHKDGSSSDDTINIYIGHYPVAR